MNPRPWLLVAGGTLVIILLATPVAVVAFRAAGQGPPYGLSWANRPDDAFLELRHAVRESDYERAHRWLRPVPRDAKESTAAPTSDVIGLFEDHDVRRMAGRAGRDRDSGTVVEGEHATIPVVARPWQDEASPDQRWTLHLRLHDREWRVCSLKVMADGAR